MEKPSENRLDWIDELRGVAALSVLGGHCRLLFQDSSITLTFLDVFPRGVQLFYLLSGLILYQLYQDKVAELQGYWVFLIRRFFRIAPMFYVAVFVCAGLFPSRVVDAPSNILTHLSLLSFGFIPEYLNGIVGVEWSVFVECWFYVLFPILVLLFQRWPYATALATLGISVLQTGFVYVREPDILTRTYFYNMPTAQMCFFVLGMFLADAVRRSSLRRPQLLFGVSVLTLLALPYFVKAFTLQLYLSYFLIAAIVYSYANLNRPFIVRMVLGFAGLISYSMYLLHMPVIELTKQIEMVSSPLKLVGMLFVLFSVCYLTYRYIELPGIRYGHRWSQRFLPSHTWNDAKRIAS